MKKIILLSMLSLLLFAGCSLIKKNDQPAKTVLTIEEAKTKAEEFINNNLMKPGTTVTIKEITEEGGLYKIVVDAGTGEDIDSYMTKDGKKFFPQALDIEEHEKENQEAADQADQPTEIVKSEKPKVDVFVMSHCPYGTQIEKGVLPVAKLLGDKIDFQVKFCDYAMHGETEINEQLNQYCIQKEQPEKFMSYLQCFLGEGESEPCLTQVKVDTSKLQSCVAAVDKEFKITENFNNKETWKGQFPPFDIYKSEAAKYGVKGSPSLVINGTKVSSGRDSASLLSIICSAFENPPEECSQELSSTTPGPGFGFEGSGSDSSASCN